VTVLCAWRPRECGRTPRRTRYSFPKMSRITLGFSCCFFKWIIDNVLTDRHNLLPRNIAHRFNTVPKYLPTRWHLWTILYFTVSLPSLYMFRASGSSLSGVHFFFLYRQSLAYCVIFCCIHPFSYVFCSRRRTDEYSKRLHRMPETACTEKKSELLMMSSLKLETCRVKDD